MTKAEIENHWRRYAGLIKQARDAEKDANFKALIGHAENSWQHIDGMLRHANKHDLETENQLHGISLVLRYAPVLFDFEVLGRLEQFLSGKRRITKSSSSDLGEDLAEARTVMMRARVVWDDLERQRQWPVDVLRRRFSGNDDEWHHIIGTWKAQNTIQTSASKGIAYVCLATRMDDAIVGKCPHCGRPDRRTKSESLAPTLCRSCRRQGVFVHIVGAHPVEY